MRYVIHFHETEASHYDLMIERGKVLETYRIGLEDMERLMRGGTAQAERIQDHRAYYLDYEGPVSCDRGYVRVFDEGICSGREFTATGGTLILEGKKFAGDLAFRPVEGEINRFTLTYAAIA